jgi:N-sulfoglucosamine sulfohydrolase
VPILPQLLREQEYRVGLLGKVEHSTPHADFEWDQCLGFEALGFGRDPETYGREARAFFADAGTRGQPFFLMANSHDPHRPFFGNDNDAWYDNEDGPTAARPSRVFRPGEVVVPPFLPDLEEVRLEIAEYYSSARRCDDTVGKLLDALDASGQTENTIVVFLSGNGMAVPFAKTNCYLNSTKTPWIVRWPRHVVGGTVNEDDFISGIDLLPTLLDAAGIELPEGVDGRSFLPLLKGEPQAGRDLVFTQLFQTARKLNYPMRCVQNARYGYIYNPWSNGTRAFQNESQHGRTFKAMEAAAEGDEAVARRVELFTHRVLEELYDFAADPAALHNLAGHPDHAEAQAELIAALTAWMEQTADPLHEAFTRRHTPEATAAAMHATAATIGGT